MDRTEFLFQLALKLGIYNFGIRAVPDTRDGRVSYLWHASFRGNDYGEQLDDITYGDFIEHVITYLEVDITAQRIARGPSDR